jgi:hypothetical protein
MKITHIALAVGLFALALVPSVASAASNVLKMPDELATKCEEIADRWNNEPNPFSSSSSTLRANALQVCKDARDYYISKDMHWEGMHLHGKPNWVWCQFHLDEDTIVAWWIILQGSNWSKPYYYQQTSNEMEWIKEGIIKHPFNPNFACTESQVKQAERLIRILAGGDE